MDHLATFSRLSQLADSHSLYKAPGLPGPEAAKYHKIGAALHTAAAKVGACVFGTNSDPMTEHHNHMAQVHTKHAQLHSGDGVVKAEYKPDWPVSSWESPVEQKVLREKARAERMKNPGVTEGPHAKGKGSFLGVPVEYKTYHK
jgi:hypothetical protein